MSHQFWIIFCSGISHGFQLNTTWNSHSALLCKKCFQDYRNITMQFAWLINSYGFFVFAFMHDNVFAIGCISGHSYDLVSVRNDFTYKQHTSPLFLRPFWLSISTVNVFQRDSRINITTFFNFPDIFRRYIRHLQCYIF